MTFHFKFVRSIEKSASTFPTTEGDVKWQSTCDMVRFKRDKRITGGGNKEGPQYERELGRTCRDVEQYVTWNSLLPSPKLE